MSIKKHNSGFTIIETLVAIGILVSIIAGAMSAVQTVLSSYIGVKYEVIATYLAQEGIEQIRNIRDENRLNGRSSWLTGIAENVGDPCTFAKVCEVSPVEPPYLRLCGDNLTDCDFLKQSPPGLHQEIFYGYNAAWTTVSPFKRSVKLTSISASEVVVTVTVSWKQGNSSRQIVLSENFMDWE